MGSDRRASFAGYFEQIALIWAIIALGMRKEFSISADNLDILTSIDRLLSNPEVCFARYQGGKIYFQMDTQDEYDYEQLLVKLISQVRA